MVASVKAVYKKGVLRLLSPVELSEGQTVNVTIETPTDVAEVDAKLRAAGLLADMDDVPDDWEELSPEERDRIGRLFLTDRTVLATKTSPIFFSEVH
jgi:predicted DNA-binding antitoxin AbrB/MazE fold protein